MPSAKPARPTSRGRPPRSSLPHGRRAESFADDLNTRRGIVSGRVALLPRSTEIQPRVAMIRPSPTPPRSKPPQVSAVPEEVGGVHRCGLACRVARNFCTSPAPQQSLQLRRATAGAWMAMQRNAQRVPPPRITGRAKLCARVPHRVSKSGGRDFAASPAPPSSRSRSGESRTRGRPDEPTARRVFGRWGFDGFCLIGRGPRQRTRIRRGKRRHVPGNACHGPRHGISVRERESRGVGPGAAGGTYGPTGARAVGFDGFPLGGRAPGAEPGKSWETRLRNPG